MNAIVRFLQDIHYRNFSGIVGLLGGLRTPDRSYALAEILGSLRTRIGYVGAGWSKGKYLRTIRTVFPEIDDSQAEVLLKAYWVNHQKRFVELFLIEKLNPHNLDCLVEFEGLEYLDRALERGRGVIFPVPHIGNERLHHIALAVKGYPMAVISSQYEDHGSFARKVKLGASLRFHDVGYSGDGLWLLKMLKENRILQIASDAEAGSNGVIVNFLGQQVLLPTGWARLAIKTEAVVFPSALLRQKDNRHKLVILPAYEVCVNGDRNERLKENVQRYMDIVSQFFLERPDQIDWMNLTVRLDETQMRLKSYQQE